MAPKPILLVIAGCNGSGKSTFSHALTPDLIIPFDYDKHFFKIYNAKFDFELRESMSHNEARQLLEDSVEDAISNSKAFCYENNFNSTPMHWPEIFRKHNYQINMMFFCLNSSAEAKRRVKIRYENGGHFVPDGEVEERFRLGYKNLDANFSNFDNLDLFDSCVHDAAPTHMISFSNGNIKTLSKFPEYIEPLLPNITKTVNQYLESKQ